MATMHNLKSPTDLRALLEAMEEGELVGQQISQQGAIHVLEFMLAHGCTEHLAGQVLASLRQNMEVVVEIAQRKGFTRVFDPSHTSLN